MCGIESTTTAVAGGQQPAASCCSLLVCSAVQRSKKQEALRSSRTGTTSRLGTSSCRCNSALYLYPNSKAAEQSNITTRNEAEEYGRPLERVTQNCVRQTTGADCQKLDSSSHQPPPFTSPSVFLPRLSYKQVEKETTMTSVPEAYMNQVGVPISRSFFSFDHVANPCCTRWTQIQQDICRSLQRNCSFDLV